jgi:hypothetical protein
MEDGMEDEIKRASVNAIPEGAVCTVQEPVF